MDFNLKQWRNHHQLESEEDEQQQQQQQQPSSAKFPKLLVDPCPPSYPQTAPLSLFIDDDPPNSKFSNLSAFPDSTTAPPATTRVPRMEGGGSCFSLAQWQELELQALIYRYMLAGASIPPELLQPIKKSLLHSPPYFLHHPLQQYYSYYQPALLQTGYWGRAAMDPEPGRCRRTDGKKWRCSRDVVAGQKYCERHVHRGRSRSRKPVEIPTPNSSTATTAKPTGGGGVGGSCGAATSATSNNTTARIVSGVTTGTGFSLSGQTSSPDLFHLNNSSLDSRHETRGLLSQTEAASRSDSHILRHFFDDWPRSSLQEPENEASPMNSATCLSISMPGNSSSDVSLKLATGNGGEEEELLQATGGSRGNGRERHHMNWTMSSMGGPLAEALGSSTSNASPTSVLHTMPRASASETSFVSS